MSFVPDSKYVTSRYFFFSFGKLKFKFEPEICKIPAKRIRVATGAELKKMCAPRPCPCPPKSPTIGMIGYILRMVGLGVKALIAGGLVYATYDMGLWGDSEQTEKLYSKTCDTFKPYFYPTIEEEPKPVDEACEAQEDLMCLVRLLFQLVHPRFIYLR